jgi:hypothetical protein
LEVEVPPDWVAVLVVDGVLAAVVVDGVVALVVGTVSCGAPFVLVD